MFRTVAYYELLRPLNEADIPVLADFAGYDAVSLVPPPPPPPRQPGAVGSLDACFLSYMRLSRYWYR